MDKNTPKFKVRLGLFVAGGLVLFVIAIFLIGRQKNLFNPVFALTTTFNNVSGLEVGSNVRFSGINVGTVNNILIINDSTVMVAMNIRKDIQQFIKTDSKAGIGSSGIIGDRLIVISQGSPDALVVKDKQLISSVEPTETDAIMLSLKVTAENAEVISDQLAEIMIKVNSGSGILGKLIQDSTMADNINKTIVNLKKSSKGLDENMNAAKSNFFLRGYFKKKAKAAEQKKEDAAEQKKEEEAEQKAKE
ncbi:MlaD family protein [Williamwhitmania taraxaci]|uniref:Phospholipid/cholesterol/gamma-HCH transport system substrate-binding protein n=1 Tax=Williamwhitmania taraxaci TaxID=1640674 RepID=A0A1G6GWF8_9BACT|nr:MlaD family protein [Williamwhitmania taraxaci]SDB85995.1 phospholipid/cholesterol/gamma-HCH transport system substrate-binding protein [Williamwhitmania taraxaci]